MKTETAAQRAYRISVEAASVGFDWNTPEDVIDKLQEELDEIRDAVQSHDDIEHVAEEVGDFFFALINFNRKMHIVSDRAFHAGVDKFERRFRSLETIIHQSGRTPSELSQEELESVWKTVKEGEKNA